MDSLWISGLLALACQLSSGQLIFPNNGLNNQGFNNGLNNQGFNNGLNNLGFNNQPQYVNGYPYSTLYGNGNGNNGIGFGGNQFCENGGSPLTSGGGPRQCWPTSPSNNRCPSGYSCTLSTDLRNFYCCSSGGFANNNNFDNNNVNYQTNPRFFAGIPNDPYASRDQPVYHQPKTHYAPRPVAHYQPPRPSNNYQPPQPSNSYQPPQPSNSYQPPQPPNPYQPPQPLPQPNYGTSNNNVGNQYGKK